MTARRTVLGRVALVAALLLAAGATLGCGVARHAEAILLLEDVRAQGGASMLSRTAPTPRLQEIAYRVGDRARLGDLIRPGDDDTARYPLVLVPGAAPRGREEPLLRAFAFSLARAGYTILVPELPNLRRLQVRPGDAVPIGDAIRHMADRVAPGRPVGLTAISYSVGPAMLALLDEEIDRRTGVMLGIGGYHDITDVIRYFTTGHYPTPEGGWARHPVRPIGKWVFAMSNAALLSDPRQRDLLQGLALRRMRDPAARISDLRAALGPEARAVLALLENPRPERVAALIDALPAPILDELRALDLSTRSLEGVSTRILLIHGSDDPVIPPGESVALAGRLGARASLYLIDGLGHVEQSGYTLSSLWRMVKATSEFLSLRDLEAGL